MFFYKAPVSSLAVAHAQDTHNPSTEKPLIQCYKCGEPCKGEVLRVQNKHFHLKCFTCKGILLQKNIKYLQNISCTCTENDKKERTDVCVLNY